MKCRIAFFHEGGYSEVYVPFCGLAVIEELSNERGDYSDPFLYEVEHWGCQELQCYQKEIIDNISEVALQKLKSRLLIK